MMKRRVLLFARDPGGANAIIPLVKALKQRLYQPLLYGKDTALNLYLSENVKGANIVDKAEVNSINGLIKFLSQIKPQAIITGTSADDFTEKYLWAAAKKLNIPTLAILDHWVNYGIRFSRFPLSDLAQFQEDKEHFFLPTAILVMDDFAKTEMIKEGFDCEKIVVTGNPYFETLIEKSNHINKKKIENFRNKNGIKEDDVVIAFASEPISNMYGGSEYLGYTENTILNEIINALLKLTKTQRQKLVFIIRPHPKENYDHFLEFKGKFESELRLIVDNQLSGSELISLVDMVSGMYSIFLIEASILEKQIISVQIGLKRTNPFVLGRMGMIQTILTSSQLEIALSDLFHGKKQVARMKIEEKSIEKIISYMEETLCQY